jgi:hypothetical protein
MTSKHDLSTYQQRKKKSNKKRKKQLLLLIFIIFNLNEHSYQQNINLLVRLPFIMAQHVI